MSVRSTKILIYDHPELHICVMWKLSHWQSIKRFSIQFFHSCPLIPFLPLALSYSPDAVTCHLCMKLCKYGWTYPGMMDVQQEGIGLVLCLRAWCRQNIACCMERQASELQADSYVAPWQGVESKHSPSFSCSREGVQGWTGFCQGGSLLQTKEGGFWRGGTFGRVISVPVTEVLFKTKSSKMRRSLFCLLAPSLKNVSAVLWFVCGWVFDCSSERGDCAFLLNGLASNFNSIRHSDAELLEVKWDWPQLRDSEERLQRAGVHWWGLCGFMQMANKASHLHCPIKDSLMISFFRRTEVA